MNFQYGLYFCVIENKSLTVIIVYCDDVFVLFCISHWSAAILDYTPMWEEHSTLALYGASQSQEISS